MPIVCAHLINNTFSIKQSYEFSTPNLPIPGAFIVADAEMEL